MRPADIHWLLELMVLDPVPLAWILPSFNRQHTNALPISDYKAHDYAQLLMSAVDQSLVQLLEGNCELSVEASRSTIARLEQRVCDLDKQIVVRLTQAGGAAWEGSAKPQWDRFLKFELRFASSDLDDCSVSGLLASRSRDVVMAYLGWYRELESVMVDWSSLKITRQGEYTATYWKHLKDMYEATFDGVHERQDRAVSPNVFDWKMSLDNWHRKPWDRLDWR
jgi:hypothetical protein